MFRLLAILEMMLSFKRKDLESLLREFPAQLGFEKLGKHKFSICEYVSTIVWLDTSPYAFSASQAFPG